MGFRTQFRDKKEWLSTTNNSIDLQTTSDEACKQYDAALTQLLGWYDDGSLGGLQGSITRMCEADPEFVLGQALKVEVNLMGGLTAPRLNQQLAKDVELFNELVARKGNLVSEQEQLHAEIVNCWAKCDPKRTSQALERLATLYPEDLSAMNMLQGAYFYAGTALPMRNSLAYCLSKISINKEPLEGYVHGMFSFALEESNMYPQAQREALRALELIPRDTWAIHNYAHCLEMQAKTEEGLKWMEDRKCDWLPCQTLACHQYWHTALFHINNNNFDEAVALLDKEVLSRCVSSSSTLDLHDAASMVYRMELVDLFGKTKGSSSSSGGGDAKEKAAANRSRWSPVYEICKPHKRDHLIGFNDVHFMMSYLGLGDMQMARELIESIDEVPTLDEGRRVVKPLLEAMYKFKLGAYSECVDLLEPIRFDIIKIGGSHAQRDVFEQLLLVAALKSDQSQHQKLGRRMIDERDAMQGRRTAQTELLAAA